MFFTLGRESAPAELPLPSWPCHPKRTPTALKFTQVPIGSELAASRGQVHGVGAGARYAAGHGSGAGRSRISARLWRPLPGAGRSPGRHPDGRRRRSSRRACFDLISWCRGHRRDGADHPRASSHETHRWREEDSNRRSLSQTSRLSDGTRDAARAKRRVSAASANFRGTERSNPASSASEADASHRT